MIDVKELRIGAHYYNTSYTKPVIGRITSIYDKDRVSLCYDMPLDPDSDPYEGAMLHDLDPIPLTAELLQELGFERLAQSGSMSSWARDDIYISIVGECVSARIVNDKNDLYISSIRYLHELEVFVYLTTKQGLIKED